MGCVICREDCMYFIWKTCVNCQSLFHPECLGQDPTREDPFWCFNCTRAHPSQSSEEQLVDDFERCTIKERKASLPITAAVKNNYTEPIDCGRIEWLDMETVAFAFQTCLTLQEYQSSLLRAEDGISVFKQGVAHIAIIHLPYENACFASNGAGKFYIDSMTWSMLKPGFYSISHLFNSVTSRERQRINPSINIALRGAMDLQRAFRVDNSSIRFAQMEPKNQFSESLRSRTLILRESRI